MCNRYVSPSDAAIERYWHIGSHSFGRWIQSFNVAPTTTVPMVRLSDAGEPEVTAARWGLIPPWWWVPKLPTLSFTARSEEAASKSMWKMSLRTHRCLLLAKGWYQWRYQQGHQQPYFIHGADSDDVLAIAGLWSEWIAPDGRFITSCALLTKPAAPAIHRIHRRMPVVLAPEQFDGWLSPGTPSSNVQALMANSRHEFTGYAVSTRVNNTRNDDVGLLEPVDAG
ncbi:SOS response-associated peptidase [Pseudomonas sp. LFM046]|uniref:SOS response-associated peptidase n=1 Tax=Pseudomonas sp. LFM046 TaxID=1608357 RepID=UPI0005CFC15C|nr:SOS response-associated peptidase [Pseudomonas sp. LFM046]